MQSTGKYTNPAHTLDRVTVLKQTTHILHLLTILRDLTTETSTFATVVHQISREVITTALDHIPFENAVIKTPVGGTFGGVSPAKGVCGVSILRAGASMENVLRESWLGKLSFGKILIQRDEETCLPQLFYSKFPPRMADDIVLLLEPMLATGGSIMKAVDVLLDKGVSQENIVLVNILASRKGLDIVAEKFPGLKIVTAAVDEELTPSNCISPGLGDFGDRYYGTC
ncbi:hypothetical protein ASPWEDRAFT_48879 [Aspergillus wentii DTO 134E9]|uniref:uracil phosphoribosyltransferase n=1 Tax=Aspergillus wentii DTO 134E9 TaxID=1073089 RepID=A0A1L9RUZ1_ASPWE|nr:uncharacterized protein ASPWEDRAFT_48879 [Aspergillus wentii DTO 134E9]OJJ38713.1 hypothetical protein ASPWEDRAFT_48879 [Aspergillus wentii DTO 134E9]